jgi:2-keto-4-pentenoate hydratase/2-oxohepta-3-ene-1,7-dioic acid hydratase in catechol pathway
LTVAAAASITDRMRLARYEHGGVARTGVVRGDELVDVGGGDLVELLAQGLDAPAGNGAAGVALADVRLLAPVEQPPKFLAIGLNYADHVAEAHLETPEFPVVFTKLSSCVNGPHDDVQRPLVSDQLDYEGELGFVIGRRCRHVARADAPGVIAGYLAVNDVSVRDWQLRTPQWTLGKSFDTHGPIGPWIATADEVGDPHALDIRTWVNGELRQQSNTSNLIHDCYALVELLSTVCTLEPGDIVSTGTPAGVGMLMDPPQLLRAGDTVRVAIERIGAIENRVVGEQPTGGTP